MARPLAKTGINSETARDLVFWTARGLGPEAAAKRAGIPSSARLYRYRRSTEFAEDLRQALKDLLALEHAPAAINILARLMADEKTPARVRVDACKTLLDRAGFTPAAVAADAPPAEDNMSLWTREQLEAFVAQGERQLAAATATDADFEVVAPSGAGGALTDML